MKSKEGLDSEFMNITFSDSAFDDLQSIKLYYREQGVPEVGQRYVAAIVEHVQILFDHPDIGRVVPEFSEDYIREIIHSPFRIVYYRHKTSVQIIRVWRSERSIRLPED